MIDLGTLGGTGSGALAVSAIGQVVGVWITAAGWTRAFSWTETVG